MRSRSRGRPEEAQLDRLRKGIVLEGHRTAPCRITWMKSTGSRDEEGGNTWFAVELSEGRTRQVREMFFRIEHPVQKLRRVAIGPLRDTELPVGAVRELSERELSMLRRATDKVVAKPGKSRTARRRPASRAEPSPRTAGAERPARPVRPARPPRAARAGDHRGAARRSPGAQVAPVGGLARQGGSGAQASRLPSEVNHSSTPPAVAGAPGHRCDRRPRRGGEEHRRAATGGSPRGSLYRHRGDVSRHGALPRRSRGRSSRIAARWPRPCAPCRFGWCLPPAAPRWSSTESTPANACGVPEVTAQTSRVAVHPEVRQRMVALQQEFVRQHGGVMEGRDIGTVVVPSTPFKFYLDAAPTVRARRRHAELVKKGTACRASGGRA